MKPIRFVLILLMAASCTKDAGQSFSKKDAAYFIYNYTDHLNRIVEYSDITFSFGMLDSSVEKDTARIAVRVLGNSSETDRFYHVSIDTDSSTAEAGLHYESFEPIQKIRAGLMVDTLKIVVLRNNLSSSHVKMENKRLLLKVTESDDFAVGVVKGAKMGLRINNYLAEPRWWKSYVSLGLNYYHPEKWKILISFNQVFADAEANYPMNVNLMTPYYNSLRTYLINNPTYDKETGARVLIDQLVP